MKEIPADETLIDLAWRGYDARAMAPTLVACGVVSLIDFLGRWLVDDLSELAERVGSLVLFVPVLLMWGVVLWILFYRSITYTYRLTNRALLVDRGFRWPPEPMVLLSAIQDVSTSTHLLGHWLDVGSVVVHTADGRRLEMNGIHAPAAFAEDIRQASKGAT